MSAGSRWPRRRRGRPATFFVLACLFGLLPDPSLRLLASARTERGRTPGAEAVPARQFSSSVNLVEVYATVTNQQGVAVAGLKPGDFEVLEDGVPQKIEAFAAGDFPLSLALAVDHSASMAKDHLPLVKQAARDFLARLRPADQAMVIGVSGEVEVLAPLSTDRAAQVRAVDSLQPWSTTSLYDAIVEGMELIQPGHGRRALIVLSDGEDRYSHATSDQVLDAARRADVIVYPVAVGRTRPSMFPELAVLTGGRSFAIRDPKRLQQALADIANELRFQYLLGYEPARTPGASRERAWHSIGVRVRQPGARVRARDGYYGS